MKAVKTDALVLSGFASKHKKSLQAVADRNYEDLPHLRAIYERLEAGQPQLNAHCKTSERNGDEGLAFRCASGEEVKLLQGSYKEPTMQAEEPTPVAPWRMLEDEGEATKAAEDEGLFLEGASGTGKTWWTRKLVEKLRAKGATVDIVDKTHAAVQNFGLGAVTLDHYVRRRIRAGALQRGYLVVGEITEVNSQLWADLVVAKMWGVKLILCDDLAQFSAICDSWLGAPLPEDVLGCSEGCGSWRARTATGSGRIGAPTRKSSTSSLRCAWGSQRREICERRWPRRARSSP